MKLHPANDKLREAEFFFTRMQDHVAQDEFRYFLNAFLSALFSCTECKKLWSADSRYKAWWQTMRTTHLSNADLQNLRKLRNREIHRKGTEALQQVSLNIPAGYVISVKPGGQHQPAAIGTGQEYPVERRWVWKTAGEPDVMDLCRKGLQVAREVIKSRDSMQFDN